MDSLVCVMRCYRKYLHLLINFYFSRQLTTMWARMGKSVIFSAMTLTGKCDRGTSVTSVLQNPLHTWLKTHMAIKGICYILTARYHVKTPPCCLPKG